MSATLRRLAIVVATALVALALWDQIVRDPAYRDWHGRVFGVPYDFRCPTPAKLFKAVWTPSDERLLSPHIFGVSWSLNAGRAFQLVKNRFRRA